MTYILQTLNCKPMASLDHVASDMLGSADLVEEVQAGASKIVKVTSIGGFRECCYTCDENIPTGGLTFDESRF